MSLSQKLKILRTENNMTQDYLAKRLNVARSTIAGYEAKNRQPSHEKLTAIANIFQVSVDYLLNDNVISLENAPNTAQTSDEKVLLQKYRTLSSSSKQECIDYLRFLHARDTKKQKQKRSGKTN